MIFNLILKLNLKTVFNSKTVLNLIFNLKMNLIFNLKMIYVSRDTQARRRRNIITKAHLWAENYNAAIQFCQELFSKNFLANLPPESQKEKAPREEPSRELMKIALFAD